MTPRGFCLATGEGNAMLRPPPATELLRNGLDFNRRTLDLNVHAFDFGDLGFFHAHAHAHAASAFLDSCFFTRADSLPFFYHLPFPPPPPPPTPASDLWHQQLREYWTCYNLSHNFSKQEPPLQQSIPGHQPRSPSKKPDRASPIINADAPPPPKPSPDLYAKYIIESPAWLPLGWITEVQTRRTGTTAGTRDKYYKDPVSGRRFRSRNEVLHFLETGKGRVRRRYKRRNMNSGSTTDTRCVTTEVVIPVGKANITDTGCQPVSCLAYLKNLEPHSVNNDNSFNTLSVAFAMPLDKEKLSQEWQPPNTFPSLSALETSADKLPPKDPMASLEPSSIKRKTCSQDMPQKAREKKKVRFESPRKGAENQDSKLWQWLQKPVGLCGATKNEHRQQRPEVMEATTAGNPEIPKESGGVVTVCNKEQAGLKCGFRGKKSKIAIDDELSKLIQKPGLTSRQRARLVQKFKARRAKQLLAILGRKICCQLLGLPA